MLASVAVAVLEDWIRITSEPGISQIKPSGVCEYSSIAGQSGRKDTVESIDTPGYTFKKIIR